MSGRPHLLMYRPPAKKIRVGLACWLCLWLWSPAVWAQRAPADTVYQLRTAREVGLLGAGVAANALAYLLDRQAAPLSLISIMDLDPNAVNRFDRGATRNYSAPAAKASDLTLLGSVGVVGLTGLATLHRRTWYLVPMMYTQTLMLTVGVQDVVKATVLRTRPFVYNAQAPLADKLDKDARRSFFSGHSAASFSSAVFASTVFGHYFPVSRLRPVVWTGSLALASTTAYLRYRAGKHYPTDLLVGAAVGSAMGWLVPRAHYRKPQTRRPHGFIRQINCSPWSSGLANGFYVQLTLN